MFKIVEVASGARVGSVGFWTKDWRDEQVYEVGWMVVPEFQGRGIAVAPTAQAIELAKPKGHFMTCNDWRLDLAQAKKRAGHIRKPIVRATLGRRTTGLEARRYGAWQALSRGPSVVLAELILTGCDFESERSNTATGANSRRAWARKLIPFATAAPCWPLRGRDSTQAPRSCGPTTMLASRRPGSCSRTAPPISGTARPPANAQKLRRLLSSYHG